MTIGAFNDAVDDIPLMGSTTRIDTALRMAQNELFLEENGGRDIAPNILVLLTDGSQTPGKNIWGFRSVSMSVSAKIP